MATINKPLVLAQQIRQLCSDPINAEHVMTSKLYEGLAEMLVQSEDQAFILLSLQSWYILGSNPLYRSKLHSCKGITAKIMKLTDSEHPKIAQLATLLLQRYNETSTQSTAPPTSQSTTTTAATGKENIKQDNTSHNATHRSTPSIDKPLSTTTTTDSTTSGKTKLTRIALKIHGVTTKPEMDTVEKAMVKVGGIVSVTVSGQLPNIDFIVYSNNSDKQEMLGEIGSALGGLDDGKYRAEETVDKHANRFAARASMAGGGGNQFSTNNKAASHGGAVAAYRNIEDSTVAARGLAARKQQAVQDEQASRVVSVFKNVSSFFW